MEALNIENTVNIRDDENYRIDDLPIVDANNKVIATVSVTTLYGGKSTRGHVHKDTHEFYYFIEGAGTMHLGTTESYRVRENSVVYVPPGVYHKIENRNDYASLIFHTFYPGGSDRPAFKD